MNLDTEYEKFDSFWKELGETTIHPKDIDALNNIKNNNFQLDTVPEPFIGNIKNARVYLLSLNPGDFDKTNKNKSDTEKFEIDARENLVAHKEKFLYLDESKLDACKSCSKKSKTNCSVCINSGTLWWKSGLLNHLETEIKKRYGKESARKKALTLIHKNICDLEIVPYHSKDSKHFGDSVYTLYSSKAMRSFVKNYVCKREDNPLIIVMRAKKEWMPCFDDYILEGKNNLFFERRA